MPWVWLCCCREAKTMQCRQYWFCFFSNYWRLIIPNVLTCDAFWIDNVLFMPSFCFNVSMHATVMMHIALLSVYMQIWVWIWACSVVYKPRYVLGPPLHMEDFQYGLYVAFLHVYHTLISCMCPSKYSLRWLLYKHFLYLSYTRMK